MDHHKILDIASSPNVNTELFAPGDRIGPYRDLGTHINFSLQSCRLVNKPWLIEYHVLSNGINDILLIDYREACGFFSLTPFDGFAGRMPITLSRIPAEPFEG
jgi:hypothetical protein